MGSSCAVSATAAVLQYIPLITSTLNEESRVGQALLDELSLLKFLFLSPYRYQQIMAVRGCSDNAIVETAVRSFLSFINMEFGQNQDIFEVLEKMIYGLKEGVKVGKY